MKKLLFLFPILAVLVAGCSRIARVSDAIAKADASAMSMRGRCLFLAMTMANIEREAEGKDLVWPKADETQVGNATEYLRTLLDMEHFGKPEWKPVSDRIDPKYVFDEKTGKAKWIIAKGFDDKLDDAVPIIVSANVDPTSLVTAEGGHDGAKLEGDLRFTGEFAVVVTKGGAARWILRKRTQKLREIYGRSEFTLPKGFGYLVP